MEESDIVDQRDGRGNAEDECLELSKRRNKRGKLESKLLPWWTFVFPDSLLSFVRADTSPSRSYKDFFNFTRRVWRSQSGWIAGTNLSLEGLSESLHLRGHSIGPSVTVVPLFFFGWAGALQFWTPAPSQRTCWLLCLSVQVSRLLTADVRPFLAVFTCSRRCFSARLLALQSNCLLCLIELKCRPNRRSKRLRCYIEWLALVATAVMKTALVIYQWAWPLCSSCHFWLPKITSSRPTPFSLRIF